MPIDRWQTVDRVVVKAALPGVKPEEVDIPITGNTLIIEGEAKAEEEVRLQGQRLRHLWSRGLGEVGFESLLKPACVTRSL